jgi:hypothetical protein
MPKILTRLRIDEVSSVDRGAGEGVKIMLMKRQGKDKPMSTKIGKMFSTLFGGGDSNVVTIDKALEGLAESVGTIVTEASTPEELSTSLSKTFEQFGDHLKSTLTAGPAVIPKEDQIMDLSILKKALGLAETATEADVSAAVAKSVAATATLAADVKKMSDELMIAKAEFTPAELDFYKASDYDEQENDGDNKLTADKKKAKKAFREASHSERSMIMKAAEPALPAHIQQIIDDNAKMAKRLAELEAGGSLVALTKQATDAGLPESEAATIQKALGGDKEAVEKLLGFIKTAQAAAKAGGVFKEFGSSTGTGVVSTAYDELAELAKALQKSDPKMTFPTAFAKVYEDPANIEIVKRERGENRPAAA